MAILSGSLDSFRRDESKPVLLPFAVRQHVQRVSLAKQSVPVFIWVTS